MMRSKFLLPLLAFLLLANAEMLFAQSAPAMGAAQFSNGVHPTFDAVFPGADARTVESFWKNELKSVSVKVTSKKELIGEAARIPAATADTLRILVKVEKPKGAPNATAHIAFLTTNGYVGPDSEQRLRDGCTAWVQQRTLALQQQVAQKALDDGKRELARQERKLEGLKRDKERAENGILKADQRTERASQEKEAALNELAASAPDSSATLDSTATIAAEKERLKQRARLQDKVKRSDSTIASSKKRKEDLQWEIKRNVDDQAAQQQAVERQQAVVNELQEKLQAIR